MAFTEEQNRALYTDGSNLLVSASAGSGKTTVMVARILRLLEQGASLKDMLICTFTNAAASDMREKISKSLIERSAEGDTFCDEQLKLLPTAKIGTIDGWCQRIVRDYFYLADISADFDILDDAESRAMSDAVMDGLIEEFLEKNGAFCAFYDVMLQKRTDQDFKKAIYKIYQFSRTQKDPEEWLDKSLDCYDEVKAERILSEYYEATRAVLFSELEELSRQAAAVGYSAMCVHCSDMASALSNYSDKIRAISRLNHDYPDINSKRDELKKRISGFIEFYHDNALLPKAEQMLPYASAVVEFTKRFSVELERVKKEKAQFDHNDIEHYAYKILCDAVAGEEIRRSSKYVFVDEYQDVNPLQDALVTAAAGGELYIVGDVKQSIYAFRMSDPDIFLEKYHDYDAFGFSEPMEFCKNFRSKVEILEFCNRVFDRAMTVDFGKVDYKKVRLDSGLGNCGGEAKLYVIAPDGSEEESVDGVYSVKDDIGATGSKALRTAEIIASGIFDCLKKPHDFDGEIRKPECGDIAVLFRSSSPVVRELYDILRDSGLEVFLRRDDYFDSAWEIKPLISFLRAVYCGYDEIALSGYLLSPLGGMDENMLLAAVKGGGELGFAAKLRKYASEHCDALSEKILSELGLIDKYRQLSRFQTVVELLGGITAEKQYFNLLIAGSGGAAGARTVSEFLDYLATLKCSGSLGEYITFLDGGGTHGAKPNVPESALKMMTMHSSKGLEFPFVFIIDADKSFNNRDLSEKIILDRDLGIVMKDLRGEQITSNRLVEAAKITLKRKLDEERLRLLYVAMTRAREGLYVYATDNGKRNLPPMLAGSLFDWIMPVAGANAEFISYGTAVTDRPWLKENDMRMAEGEESELTEEIRKRINYVYPYSDVRIKASVTGLAGEESVSFVGLIEDDEKRRSIAELGTLYHAVMESMDFSRGFDGQWEQYGYGADGRVDAELIRSAFDAVNGLIECFGGKVYKEQSFVYNDKSGMLVQGIIDLMLVTGGEAILLDYKLGGEKNLLKPEYVYQLNRYADAVEDVLGLKVKGMFLYSFTSKCLKSVEREQK